jgi:lipoprotein-releasing system permease protein
MLKLFLWLRYLRKRRIVFLSIAAVALSTALLIVVASLFGGFVAGIDKAAARILGDIYFDPGVRVEGSEEFGRSLESLKEVEAATAVLETYGLLYLGPGNVRAVRVLGIEPETYSAVTGLRDCLLGQKGSSGKVTFGAADANRPGGGFVSIGVLGEPDENTDEYDFKGNQDKWLGEDVVLTTGVVTAREGAEGAGQTRLQRRSRKFRISDIVFVGIYWQDSSDIYLPIEQVRELVRADGGSEGPHEVFKVKLAPSFDAGEAVEIVGREWMRFAGEKGLDASALVRATIETSRQMQARLVGEIEKQMSILLLIFGVISSIGVLLMFCIFYMIVMTRRKDIAVIKSCGAGNWPVAAIFLGFGGCVGVIGTAVGTALGYVVIRNINVVEEWVRIVFGLKLWKASRYMFSQIPNEMDWHAAVWIGLFIAAASVLGALVPAIVAARTRPVEILRYE